MPEWSTGDILNIGKSGANGGGTIQGGTLASDNLVLQSTSHATKGTTLFDGTGLDSTTTPSSAELTPVGIIDNKDAITTEAGDFSLKVLTDAHDAQNIVWQNSGGNYNWRFTRTNSATPNLVFSTKFGSNSATKSLLSDDVLTLSNAAGKVTAHNDLDVGGNADVTGTLDVTGDTTLANADVTGTLDVTGDTTLTGDLDVTGGITSTEPIVVNTPFINVNSAASIAGNDAGLAVDRYSDDITSGTAAETGTVGGTGNTTTTIHINSAASSVNDFYNGYYISITSGPASGDKRKILDYVGASKLATVDTLTGTPSSGNTYSLYSESVAALFYDESTDAFRASYIPTATSSGAVTIIDNLAFNAGSFKVDGGTFLSYIGGTGSSPDNLLIGPSNVTGGSSADTIVIGKGAGGSTMSGDFNTFMGVNAGDSMTSGTDCIYIGRNAGATITTGSTNIMIGNNTGNGIGGSDNVYVGYQAGNNGTGNVAIGSDALGKVIGSSDNNVVIGRDAFRASTESAGLNDSVIIGFEAAKGVSGTSTQDNVIIGYQAGLTVTSGNSNVFVGYQAGDTITEGNNNSLLGFTAGQFITTGDNNTCFGRNAGGTFLIAQDGITCIGNNAAVGSGNTGVICIGSDATSTADDQLVFPNTIDHIKMSGLADTATTGKMMIFEGDDIRALNELQWNGSGIVITGNNTTNGVGVFQNQITVSGTGANEGDTLIEDNAVHINYNLANSNSDATLGFFTDIAAATSYTSQIVRDLGPNGAWNFNHKGTGDVRVITQDSSANIDLNVNGTDRLTVTNTGATVTGTLDAGAVTVDNLSLDGNTLTTTSGNLTLDATGDVLLTGNPSAALGVATKQYVDSIASASISWKEPVRVKTEAALSTYTYDNGTAGVGATIEATANAAIVIAGVSLAINDRVLVDSVGTTSDTHNGIYYVSVVGDGSTQWELTRTTGTDEPSEVADGAAVFVSEGACANCGYTQTETVTDIDADDIIWVQFTGIGDLVAGTGIDKTGSTISIDTAWPGQTALTTLGTVTTGTWTVPGTGITTGSVNKVTITEPAASATLTIANTKALTVNESLTLTADSTSSVDFGTGGDVVFAAGGLSQFAADSTSSAELLSVISDETGSGLLVFDTSPTLVTPTLGVATATSINNVELDVSNDSITLCGTTPSGITGANNVVIGSVTAAAITSGGNNIAIGDGALAALSTGNFCVTIGSNAGAATSTTLTAIGDSSGVNSTGAGNTFLGFRSGQYVTTSTNCTALGYQSLQGDSGGATGVSNTAVGYQSGAKVTTGGGNCMLGVFSGFNLTEGTNNTLLGNGSGNLITTGSTNVCVGGAAGGALTTESNNVLIGYFAGDLITAAGSTIVGSNAGKAASSNALTAFGYFAGASSTGINCTFVGYQAGSGAVGARVTAVGYQSGQALTSGNDMVIIGSGAAKLMTTGDNSVVIGSGAANEIVTGGSNCVIVGYNAGQQTNSGNSVIIGSQAGQYGDTTGGPAQNVFIGVAAGQGVNDTSTGDFNVAVGYNSLNAYTTGSNNVSFGHGSGDLITEGSNNVLMGSNAGNTITTGSNNTCIGNNADISSATANSRIALGAGSIADENNQLMLPAALTHIHMAGLGTSLTGNVMVYNTSTDHIESNSNVTWDGSSFDITGALDVSGVSTIDLDTCTFDGAEFKSGNGSVGDGKVLTLNSSAEASWQTPASGISGSGTDNNIVRWNGTSAVQDSSVSIDDSGNLDIAGGAEYQIGGSIYLTRYGGSDADPNHIAIGPGAGGAGNGANCVMIGKDAGTAVSSFNNTLIGSDSGISVTSGTNNTAVGANTLTGVTTTATDHNTAIGAGAMKDGTAHDQSVAIGYQCMDTGAGNTGAVGIGWRALRVNTAANTIGIGWQAGFAQTSGTDNMYIGVNAGDSITTGDQNIVIGNDAMPGVAASTDNTIIGFEAGDSTVGDDNVIIGSTAASGAAALESVIIGAATGHTATTGAIEYSVIIGKGMDNFGSGTGGDVWIGQHNGRTGVYTGNSNAYIGRDSGRSATSSARNVCLGNGCGDDITTASDCTFIGASVSTGANGATAHSTAAETTVVGSEAEGGNYAGCVVLGYRAQATAANQILFKPGCTSMTASGVTTLTLGTLGSITGSSILYQHASNGTIGPTTSSIRYKNSVEDLEIDTTKLYDLRPVSFTYNDSPNTRAPGLIAEEVMEVIPDLVVTKKYQLLDGEHIPIDENTPEDAVTEFIPESVRYDLMPVLNLKEIQKLKAESEAKDAKIASLEASIAVLQQQMATVLAAM